MKSRILVISAAEMELLMLCDRIPSAGETIRGKGYEYIPGGKGTNAAVTLSRLGGDCVFCSCLGDDENGAKLRRYYNECGVDTRFLATDRNAKTGFTAAICEKNDNLRALTFRGASDLLTREHIEEAFTCYPDAVYVQTVLESRLLAKATRFAVQQKIPVFIDASGIGKEYPFEELESIEIFQTSAQDAYRITGIMPTDMENCMKSAMALESRVKAKFYVIRIPGRGAFIYDGRYYQMQPTYDVDRADTAEAADAFNASLALNYLTTHDIKNACSFASAVGEVTTDMHESLDPIPELCKVREYILSFKPSIKM